MPTAGRLLAVLSVLLAAPGALSAQSRTPDQTAVAQVVREFHAALGRGDSTAALALLAEDATILESGGRESKAEYRAHHLPGDIAFARAVPRREETSEVTVAGDVAWAASTGTTKGEFRGRTIDVATAELVVLGRAPAGWRIRAIHWSSRPRGR